MECLIKNAHKRLIECHRLWHQTMDNYFDPEGFRVNLNALVQALRNLTFALQNEKDAFANFEQWYSNWQATMKKDPILKWLNDARVAIVHQKDLEKISIARVTIFGYNEIFKADIEFPIEMSENMIAIFLLSKKYINEEIILNDFILKVERRWVIDSLPGYEVLDALAYCYGFMRKILDDAHKELHININACNVKDHFHKEYDITHNDLGIPNCIDMSNSVRFKNISLKQLETKEMKESYLTLDEKLVTKAKKRYKIDEGSYEFVKKSNGIKDFALNLNEIAKKILAKDGYHMPIFLLFDKDGNMQFQGSKIPNDKSDKFLIMESIAQKVRRYNSSGIIFLAESWITSDIEAYRKRIPTEEHKGREECIIVYVATKEGINDNLITVFHRGRFGGIKFDETIESKGSISGMLDPIFKVWEEN